MMRKEGIQMKRTYKVKTMAVITTIMVGVGTMGMPVLAATETTTIETTTTEATTPVKEETVYAIVDEIGGVKKVIVSDQLKNLGNQKMIKDISNLEEVSNVKGNEKSTHLGNSLVWDGAGSDICYQGTTKEELPVAVKISYQLDGIQITPKELKGKSGHLTMRYEYTTTQKEGEIYTPFLMVTGMILDEGKYSNLSITNGKLMSDGERNMVMGMGIPKLKESLGIDSIDIPDYFEVSVDVKEYEPLDTITVATNDLFNHIGFDKLGDMEELKSSMDQLQKASLALVEGTTQLHDGLDELLAKSSELTGGIKQLASGSDSLEKGTNSLANGTKQLKAGATKLEEGLGRVTTGLERADANTKNLGAGANKVTAGLETIENGASTLEQQLGNLSGGLLQASQGLSNTITAEETAIQSLSGMKDGNNDATIDSIVATINAAKQGQQDIMNQLSQGGQLGGGALGLQQGAQTLQMGAGDAKAGAAQVSGGLVQLEEGLVTLYNGAVEVRGGTGTLKAGICDADAGAVKLQDGATALSDGIGTLQSGSGQLIDGVQQLDNGAATLNKGMIEFNETGIEKLVNVFNQDIGGMLGKLTEVMNVSKDYKNFSGISEDMNGSVKFIFTTKE